MGARPFVSVMGKPAEATIFDAGDFEWTLALWVETVTCQARGLSIGQLAFTH